MFEILLKQIINQNCINFIKNQSMDIASQSSPISGNYLFHSPFLISKPPINFKNSRTTNHKQVRYHRSAKSQNNLNQHNSSRVQSADNSAVQALQFCKTENQKQNTSNLFQGKVLILNRQKMNKGKSRVIQAKHNAVSCQKHKQSSSNDYAMRLFSQYYNKYNHSEIDKTLNFQQINFAAEVEGNQCWIAKKRAAYGKNKQNYKQLQRHKKQPNQRKLIPGTNAGINTNLSTKSTNEKLFVNGAGVTINNSNANSKCNNQTNKQHSKIIDQLQLIQNVCKQSHFQSGSEQQKCEETNIFERFIPYNHNQKDRLSEFNAQVNNQENTCDFTQKYQSQYNTKTDAVLLERTNQMLHQSSLTSKHNKNKKISSSRALQYFCQLLKRQNIDKMIIKKTFNHSREINAKKMVLQQRKDNSNQLNMRNFIHKKRNSVLSAGGQRKSYKSKINIDQNFEIVGWDVDY